MEQLMAHAMASHNPQQHQFHPGQIDMKHFGAPFAQPPHGIGLPQQALMGNPNMGMNHPHHPSISLQIPDPHKLGKPEHQGYNNKMQHQLPNQNSFPLDCQYPLMSPAPLAQNLTVNKKEKSPVSSGGSSSFGSDREDPWLNSVNANNVNANANVNVNNATANTNNGKSKKGKSSRRASEPGGTTKASKSQQNRRFSANSNPPPAPLPEKDKPFQCETCFRRFTQRIGMLQHQRRHTGERPFGCNFCDKRFTQKSGLVQHERLHNGEKPFGCTFCEKAFTQKSGLVQHERTHTGEKPYVCPICSKAFTQLSGLKQHKKVHERASDSSK